METRSEIHRHAPGHPARKSTYRTVEGKSVQTRWRPLNEFTDESIPKLRNLRRAQQAGIRVPITVWAWGDDLSGSAVELQVASDNIPIPWIVRSASPSEDGHSTSNAGRFLSLNVQHPSEFAAAVTRVVASLPRNGHKVVGAVFVQPLIHGEQAGVTFFDGFYYEEAISNGDNQALTAGGKRGLVRRGHIKRGEPRLAWLRKVHDLFGGRLDLEWTEPSTREEPILLQVRPALFPIRRNETLSLANHKEIVGDPPSPWIVGVLVEAGREVMRYFEQADPSIAEWHECYAFDLAERAWMNQSAFFHIMDLWGMPRTFVTEGVGGESAGPDDACYNLPRLIAKLPVLARLAWVNLRTIAGIRRTLRALSVELDAAQTLLDLQRLNVKAQDFSYRTNFAILANLTIVSKLRKALGFAQAARVVTHQMMVRYAALAELRTWQEKSKGLDDWLREFGHRGPFETDPCRPRFLELRGELEANLRAATAAERLPRTQPSMLRAMLGRPFFWMDEYREWFRDRLMFWWAGLRQKILVQARQAVARGYLRDETDVFFLRSDDLRADPRLWCNRAAERKSRWEEATKIVLANTASRDQIESVIARRSVVNCDAHSARFSGIGLGRASVTGTAVRAIDLCSVLQGKGLPRSPILVAPTLEPAWAVVFPKFAGVIADLGGELSHAAILLREAGIPAVINARGAFAAIAEGDSIRIDPIRGEVVVDRRSIRVRRVAKRKSETPI
jgi:phosphohistidine swiveling domain-containing protein